MEIWGTVLLKMHIIKNKRQSKTKYVQGSKMKTLLCLSVTRLHLERTYSGPASGSTLRADGGVQLGWGSPPTDWSKATLRAAPPEGGAVPALLQASPPRSPSGDWLAREHRPPSRSAPRAPRWAHGQATAQGVTESRARIPFWLLSLGRRIRSEC